MKSTFTIVLKESIRYWEALALIPEERAYAERMLRVRRGQLQKVRRRQRMEKVGREG